MLRSNQTLSLFPSVHPSVLPQATIASRFPSVGPVYAPDLHHLLPPIVGPVYSPDLHHLLPTIVGPVYDPDHNQPSSPHGYAPVSSPDPNSTCPLSPPPSDSLFTLLAPKILHHNPPKQCYCLRPYTPFSLQTP